MRGEARAAADLEGLLSTGSRVTTALVLEVSFLGRPVIKATYQKKQEK